MGHWTLNTGRRTPDTASRFLLSAFCLLLSACSAPASASSEPNATEFIQTRVVEVLTENALTAAAPHIDTPVPPPITETAVPVIPSATTNGVTVATFTPRPLPTAGATVTPEPSAAVSATPARFCPDQACATAAEHFWLERPIPLGYVNYADPTYRYGSTLDNTREPHHGIELVNLSGTPIIAAGAGAVVVAGNDWVTAYGPSLYFYGNLVVVELDQRYNGEPVYNLYAHMQDQSIVVHVGQHVNTGDVLGAVGYTGVAVGPHLHFEVRVGKNDYYSTRNPELWLKPLNYNGKPWGALAGRVMLEDGTPLDNYTVVLRPEAVNYDDPRTKFLTTYAREWLNGDDALQENFAVGDLPLGTYTVSVNTTTIYRQTITVTSGHLTWVTFVVKPPAPTGTPTP